jgi:hypothetical protein
MLSGDQAGCGDGFEGVFPKHGFGKVAVGLGGFGGFDGELDPKVIERAGDVLIIYAFDGDQLYDGDELSYVRS